MRQIAERMAARGHDVTVATSFHPDRRSKVVNGVRIRAFVAGGKSVYGLSGEIEAYREFVRTFPMDAILIMAAQQWSFDALWPVLDNIKARKVFIPCGFSGLYEPDFADYFRALPDILRKFDHLVFHAEKYRDIDFVRSIGLTNFTVLPNGISEADFEREADPEFRQRMAIPEDAFLFMTVGNPIEAKGHRDVVEAFLHLDTGGRSAVLMSIAGWPAIDSGYLRHVKAAVRFAMTLAARAVAVIRREGWRGLQRLVRRGLKKSHQVIVIRLVNSRLGHVARFIDAALRRVIHIARVEGWLGIKRLVLRKLGRKPPAPVGAAPCSDIQSEGEHIATAAAPPPAPVASIESIAAKASAQPHKRVILTDLTRPELIQAYMAADLFVFASRIEYSPLVLYEAAAAGTAFVTVPVGNADEIVRWTGGGLLCEATKDTLGYTRVDPRNLAKVMGNCMREPDILARLGTTGRQRWRKHFTWQVVAGYYEDILSGKTPDIRITDLQSPEQPALDPLGQPISSVA
ncbi:glycosyltransferase involved in cell wall biosynthesis [Bradyrhizobium sp. CIR18]|nr:glycosyltransferase involved in cell wall biosynthesis [Bradyrhizobium sp. CIR18]